VSRPDRRPRVAVDFAPPRRPGRTRALVALVVIVLSLGAVTVAVSQLLLR
jgi:hypothetical protein